MLHLSQPRRLFIITRNPAAVAELPRTSQGRVFAYARISTVDQSTKNQLQEIRSAGFVIESKRAITEKISGSFVAAQRPAFSKLLDRMEEGDILVVTKLDRLGRNATDVRARVERLAGLRKAVAVSREEASRRKSSAQQKAQG